MRKAPLWLPVPLAALIVLLVLELGPKEDFEFGTPAPPATGPNVAADDFAFLRVMPEPRFVHVCSGCGECVHPFEIIENRRVMTLSSRPGGLRRLWASKRTWYYDDPIHLLADWGKNRSAETPAGLWTIRFRAASATHRSAPPHDCGQIPGEIRLSYELVMSEDPLEETFHSGDGPLRIPRTIPWLITNPGRQISLGWRLRADPGVQVDVCPCARP